MPPSRLRGVLRCLLIPLAIFSVFSLVAESWYDKVHVLVLKQAASVLKAWDQASPASGTYAEMYDEARYFKDLARGASDEDWEPSVGGNARAFRHYYDPDAPEGQQGVRYYPYYVLWNQFDGSEVSAPASGYYEGALEWATREDTGNALNWPGAISAYNYTEDSRKEAYARLGRVAHLLADTTDPDHAFNVPHPGSGRVLPNDLSQMLGDGMIALVKLRGLPPAQESALIMWLALAHAVVFDAQYGAVRPTQWTGFEGLIEDQVDPALVSGLFPASRNRPLLARTRPAMPFAGREPMIGPRDARDYFEQLARLTKGTAEAVCRIPGRAYAGRDTGLSIPLGLADLSERLSTGTVADLVLMAPIHIIPTIEVDNDEATRPFFDLAWPLLANATDYVAGLMILFHDIVAQPPYVRAVEIDQAAGGHYVASWKDQAWQRMITRDDRRYHTVTGREWVSGSQLPLAAGVPATVRLDFGPEDAKLRAHIDAASIKVSVGPHVVSGRLVSPAVWEGTFTPELGTGEIDKTFPVFIIAKDLDRHYRREGLPESGYMLDTSPATPAVPNRLSPYEWTGYEPGADRTHRVVVRAGKPREAPTVVPPPPSRDDFGLLQGELDPDLVNKKVESRGLTGVVSTFKSDPVQIRIADGVAHFLTPEVVYTVTEIHRGTQLYRRVRRQMFKDGRCSGSCSGTFTVADTWTYPDHTEPERVYPTENNWRLYRESSGRWILELPNGQPPSYGDIPYVFRAAER